MADKIIELNMNTGSGYSRIDVYTPKENIANNPLGGVYGEFSYTLSANGWVNGQQSFLNGAVLESDIVKVLPVYSGTEKERQKQNKEYIKIDSVESYDGVILFSARNAPTVDIDIRVWWTR